MKLRAKKDCKRYAAIAAAVVAAFGLAGALAGVLHAAPSFLHIRQNLSCTGCTSAYPELAVSPDRNYLAVTWVEGYDEDSGSTGHVYLRVASESGGFGPLIEVYHGSESTSCAYDRAAVAITGTTAHIAYVVFPDCATKQQTRVYYTTCSLTGGTCGSNELVLSPPAAQKILWVDIAVDEDENPHLVYAQYEGSPLTGKIFYKGHTGSGWGSNYAVYNQALTDNHTPAIAWSDDCAHVVWENETYGDIFYRRRCTGTWDPNPSTIYNSTPDYPPHGPDVAAAPGGRVFVVWDSLAQAATAYNPATHYLLYKRSNDSGLNFSPVAYPLEVGTDNTGSVLDPYTEHVVGAAEETAYLKYLQPSVALNEDGWPAVVWHTGGVTGTYYTYATSGTDTSVDWVESKTLLFAGQAGAPAVAFGGWITDTIPLLHFAYMGTTGKSWNVYYDSNEAAIIDPPKTYLPLVMRGY